MRSKTTISACLIVRDEPLLEEAVWSIRPHVDEMCIVDTGSTDGTAAVAMRLADKTILTHEFNDEHGLLTDFSAARNRSFDMATCDWIVWLDSDDVVDGADRLRAAIQEYAADDIRVVCPYEYAYDKETGKCSLLQQRERMVRNHGGWHWVRPVHEHLVRKDGTRPHDVRCDVVWKHQRKPGTEITTRNLRILEREYKRVGAEGADAWLHLNIGLELQRAQRASEALGHFRAYMTQSAWDEEKVLCCLRAADAELGLGVLDRSAQDRAIEWAKRAQGLRPSWFEGYFAEAKIWMLRAITSDGARSFSEKAAEMLRKALSMGPTDTPVATNPLDRIQHAPEMLRQACELLADWRGASEAIEMLLAHEPDKETLFLAKRRYDAMATIGGLRAPWTREESA